MSTSIQPPSKIHVTGVTRVAAFAKHPESLAFAAVTRLRHFPYTRCNAAQMCNARPNPRLLRAELRLTLQKHDSRWLRPQNAGRGIARYTLRTIGND